MGQREIYNWMKANEGVWFNAHQGCECMSMQRTQFRKYINKMLSYPEIFPGLQVKQEREIREGDMKGTYLIKYYRVKINTDI